MTIPYTYDTNKKHAVVQVENTSNLIQGAASLTYNAFNKVATVVQGTNTLTITYGPDRQRTKTVLVNGSNTTTTLYADNYEQRTVNGTTTTYHYVASPDGLAAVYVKSGSTATAYYIETDHLGSIIRAYDYIGNTKFSAAYDAWGNQTVSTNAIGITRGYTGHEHWNQFGLIDMNGRFYDPLLGRFLSPDPYVQAPDNPQSYNRYAYCFNNPLKYTDPSGNIAEFWAFFIFSTISNGLWQGVEASARDQSFWGGFGKGAAIGAASSAAGSYVGQLASSAGFMGGFAGGFAGGFTGGFIAGYGNALINHSSDPLMQGIYGGLAGGAIGGLAGGLNAGGYARDNGGNYWTGNGTTFDVIATESNISIGEGMEYSNEYAREFSDKYFGKIESVKKSVNELFADGSLPDGYYTEKGKTYNPKGTQVNGSCVYLGKGKSDVYLYKTAFTSKERLYLTMGHEYLHACFRTIGSFPSERQHASIYLWESRQCFAWNYQSNSYHRYIQYYDYLFPLLDYSDFGFKILPNKPF